MDTRHVHTFVIGAGFAGLCMAIKLQEAGEPDFLVAERGSDVGGTWRDNTYPGAACDVPSQLYSYSFAPNPVWSRSFSPQPEIQAYIQRVAEESGRARPVRLRRRRRGRPLGRRHRHAGTSAPRAGDCTADVLVSAAGALSDARAARHRRHRLVPGRDLPLRAVATTTTTSPASGSRSSAPAPRRSRSSPRSPTGSSTSTSTSAPRRTSSRGATASTRRSRSSPSSTCRRCRRPTAPAIYWMRRGAGAGVRRQPGDRRRPPRRPALLNISRGTSDPELREKVKPDFEIGCKRILISNDWYPALDRDDVDLVTDRDQQGHRRVPSSPRTAPSARSTC